MLFLALAATTKKFLVILSLFRVVFKVSPIFSSVMIAGHFSLQICLFVEYPDQGHIQVPLSPYLKGVKFLTTYSRVLTAE